MAALLSLILTTILSSSSVVVASIQSVSASDPGCPECLRPHSSFGDPFAPFVNFQSSELLFKERGQERFISYLFTILNGTSTGFYIEFKACANHLFGQGTWKNGPIIESYTPK